MENVMLLSKCAFAAKSPSSMPKTHNILLFERGSGDFSIPLFILLFKFGCFPLPPFSTFGLAYFFFPYSV